MKRAIGVKRPLCWVIGHRWSIRIRKEPERDYTIVHPPSVDGTVMAFVERKCRRCGREERGMIVDGEFVDDRQYPAPPAKLAVDGVMSDLEQAIPVGESRQWGHSAIHRKGENYYVLIYGYY